MILRELEPILTPHCRAVERRMERVPELANLRLPVVAKANFAGVPEASASRFLQISPAAYRRGPGGGELLVNMEEFLTLRAGVREAIIAHEIGHVMCDECGAPPFLQPLTVSPVPAADLDDCIVADIWACSWGYLEPLSAERLESRGSDYVSILAEWETAEDLFDRLLRWQFARLAGLKK